MLEEVLLYLNNWFITEIYSDIYTIEEESIELPFLKRGQYYRIIGSLFNDGLHRYGDDYDELEDETFDGTIWALAVPRIVRDITIEIENWQEKYGDAIDGPYNSESFGGYSYTKGTSYSSGDEVTWHTKFAKKLAPFRKIRETAYVEGTAHRDPGYRRPFNPDYPWG